MGFFDPPLVASKDRVSKRQLEVIALKCAGLTNRDVGDRLGISAQTVKNHISLVFQRSGESSMCKICFDYGVRRGKSERKP
jgi:DNA-binding NarL/FixJ family response regulator